VLVRCQLQPRNSIVMENPPSFWGVRLTLLSHARNNHLARITLNHIISDGGMTVSDRRAAYGFICVM